MSKGTIGYIKAQPAPCLYLPTLRIQMMAIPIPEIIITMTSLLCLPNEIPDYSLLRNCWKLTTKEE